MIKINRQELLKEIGYTRPENELTDSDWQNISINYDISIEFAKTFKDKLDWDYIVIYRTLSEEFIRENIDQFDWYHLSKNQTLSESFIKEFKEKLYWKNITKYQTLSDDFLNEFNDKIIWDLYFSYKTASYEIVVKYLPRTSIKKLEHIRYYTNSVEEQQKIKELFKFMNLYNRE